MVLEVTKDSDNVTKISLTWLFVVTPNVRHRKLYIKLPKGEHPVATSNNNPLP